VIDEAGARVKLRVRRDTGSRADAFEDRDRGIYFRGPSLGATTLDDDEMLMSVEVTRDDIEEVIARWTGIPVTSLKEEETQKLLRIEDELRNRVIAQRPQSPRSRAPSAARAPD
jgi:ATP-dependent Clp protease ATP-binding subunit ClpC